MTPVHRWCLKTGRIIHLVLSMIGMLSLLFFAVTGLLLNHEADWFETQVHLTTKEAALPTDLLGMVQKAAKAKTAPPEDDDGSPVAEVNAAEAYLVAYLRANCELRGDHTCEFEPDLARVEFKAPGRTDMAIIRWEDDKGDPKENALTIEYRDRGLLVRFLDLHRGKGKGSGWIWSLLLDITCGLVVLLSMTGLLIWTSLKTRRMLGMAALVAGVGLTVAIYAFWVP